MAGRGIRRSRRGASAQKYGYPQTIGFPIDSNQFGWFCGPPLEETFILTSKGCLEECDLQTGGRQIRPVWPRYCVCRSDRYVYSQARTCINIYEYVWTRGGQNSKHECTGSTATDRDQIYCIKYMLYYIILYVLYYIISYYIILYYIILYYITILLCALCCLSVILRATKERKSGNAKWRSEAKQANKKKRNKSNLKRKTREPLRIIRNDVVFRKHTLVLFVALILI